MRRRLFSRRLHRQRLEWGSHAPKERKGLFKFEVGLLVLSGCAAIGVYLTAVLPLSTSPSSPPTGIAIGWAGQQLRGYTETNYVSADSCEEPVKVVLHLYRIGLPPEPEYTQKLTPGKVAFAITGDSEIRPEDVSVWAPQSGRNAINRFLFDVQTPLPPRLPFQARIWPDPSTGEQESLAFVFEWDPVAHPEIEVFFEADWLSPRTANQSCWLSLPGQLGEGNGASGVANAALGHAEWSRSKLGLPLFQAGTYVNLYSDSELLVNSAGSIPAPNHIEPPTWDCGGTNFQASSCQAAVALEPPNAEASRSERLVVWSTLGGLLLSICGGAFIAAIRQVMKTEPRKP